MAKKKILIVDDSDFYAKLIETALTQGGYEVVRAACGEDGLRLVREEKPDLVLLDIVMPGINGFEVCRILRASERNNLMPIIMLTSRSSHEDMLTGLELGADDYIFKPFDNRELLSRVRNTLRRIDRNRNANPLTGLQGNLEIQRELDYRIERKLPFAAIYADLDNFKAYNDVYGFLKGDIAIKLTADILCDAAKRCCGSFVGHIGGDDFIMIVAPGHADAICKSIIAAFDARVRDLYSPEDLARGHIVTTDRLGETVFFPIQTISLAVVTSENRTFTTHLEVSDIAAELKKTAKAERGSIYIRDARGK
ncbi:response regulator receiver modulated diguanylate cyclase [Sporobacter termitidis DSM 10068]|uniref:Stage 0 sporulation protein A homolog n=1 Tax=Sporobacter termitidis DSM 10068 TaxID=1123282 RepID=A0A1M5ZH62_9FIRM|nr:response regulator [Sporobacter termitidis]SHI23512.1 response regulator receiver modulated diguanylate cyclase [Sporobacter termitidis DSM 10068]